MKKARDFPQRIHPSFKDIRTKKSWMVLAISMCLTSLGAFAQGSTASSTDQGVSYGKPSASDASRRSGSMDQFSNPNRWSGSVGSSSTGGSSDSSASAADALRGTGNMDQFSNPNRWGG